MRVRYTLQAQNDLDAIFFYLDQQDPAAAHSVKKFIEERIARLAQFPLMAPTTDEPGIYELTMARYPHKVYYEVEGDGVWVVHIRDTRRRPWKGER
jgi:plasmid stabilization system protein ParE